MVPQRYLVENGSNGLKNWMDNNRLHVQQRSVHTERPGNLRQYGMALSIIFKFVFAGKNDERRAILLGKFVAVRDLLPLLPKGEETQSRAFSVGQSGFLFV